ncbi:MAG TPA: hypothetical protein VFQ87_03270 [Bradyrhizobium sp.]|nr:hypothetical protein [Bradyrhizobium sp.]
MTGGLHVPAWVRKHRHPIVQAAIVMAEAAFKDRFNLQRSQRDTDGELIRRSLDAFLLRACAPDAEGKGLNYRRADHLQVLLSMWLVMLGCLDFKTWRLREPDHELAKKSPSPTVWRLAELAEEIPADRPFDPADPPDCVERALRTFRRTFLYFTKQERTTKDGEWVSTGGALRKLKAKILARFGGKFGRLVRVQQKTNKEQRAQRDQAEAEELTATEEMDRPPPSPSEKEAAAAAAAERYAHQRTTRGTPSPAEVEAVLAELGIDVATATGADYARAMAEVRRREGRAPPPPD